MGAIFAGIITLLTSQASIGFLIAGGLYAVLTIVIPLVMGYMSGYTSVSGLNSLFGGIPDGMYWALYYFKFDVGLPAIISAAVTRFIIRLIPFR